MAVKWDFTWNCYWKLLKTASSNGFVRSEKLVIDKLQTSQNGYEAKSEKFIFDVENLFKFFSSNEKSFENWKKKYFMSKYFLE